MNMPDAQNHFGGFNAESQVTHIDSLYCPDWAITSSRAQEYPVQPQLVSCERPPNTNDSMIKGTVCVCVCHAAFVLGVLWSTWLANQAWTGQSLLSAGALQEYKYQRVCQRTGVQASAAIGTGSWSFVIRAAAVNQPVTAFTKGYKG